MPRSALTGSRIRERRITQQIKQAELARKVGISASYLNLIEHNRRRIGGKLLIDLASALAVEPTSLSRGAEETILEALRDAALSEPGVPAEMPAMDQLVGRFPGWAELIARQIQKINDQTQTIERLSDRLAHDPFLAESLHEVLSVVTAIRSTSSILAQTPDIDTDWQRRFQNNLYQDSTRLAETAQSLVTYFDAMAKKEIGFSTPYETVMSFLAETDFHLAELEQGQVDVPDLLTRLPSQDRSVIDLAEQMLRRYASDAAALSLPRLGDAISRCGYEPGALARDLDADLPLLFRRLAALAPAKAKPDIGLVQCDGAGALMFQKEIEGFSVPRFGAACPLWPLFQVLLRPMVPIQQRVEAPGGQVFNAYAVCQPKPMASFDQATVLEAWMLVLPESESGKEPQKIGTTCRICPRTRCAARREQSILAEGF